MVDFQAPHLHWEFKGEHVLFPFIVLTSFPSLLLASLLLIVICVMERLVSHYHGEAKLSKATSHRARWRLALWRFLLYWIATVLRLCYMLAGMTFNMALLLVMATSLSVTQLFIELRKPSNPENDSFQPLEQRHSDLLLPSNSSLELGGGHIKTRPRSRSKPDDIYIHPNESNIARADALISSQYQTVGDQSWDEAKAHRRTTSGFKVGEESESDDDDIADVSRNRLVQ
ncbi:hypothetical protein FA15DRAFT_667071 [Coprinopsis marcescibilis]|uniref:Copper transporter n=1 Tax=Coprinopsis marcescibilis TaxID=230819 RepID=A0A5C3LEA4_COPMA|nr:hypothetical protein FA15DRAFT_667071 [Coprinopsis marcescibilis]